MTTETTIQNKELLLQNNIEGKCDQYDPDEPEEEAIALATKEVSQEVSQ